ncbi:MAG: malate dehydrogenase [Nitrospiria bacterium]
MLKRSKVTIIGAGHVGGTTAQRLAEKEIADLVLVDIEADMPRGKALDLWESAPIYGYDCRITGGGDYEATEGSDLVVITSGIARKPGMSRDDLLRVNANIVKEVTEAVVKRSPEAILIVVSNPLDAMTYVAYQTSGFPKERVVGMAGVLDSARFRAFLAMELNISIESIQTLVLGGHGDSMVPLPRYTTVSGIPVLDLIPKERLDAIVQRARNGGAEIVKLLKTGSAYFAPSAAIVEMVETILKDKKKILPCSSLCQGEYKVDGVFIGVPVILGKNGVEDILEIKLSPDETSNLMRSAKSVQILCKTVDEVL